MLETSFTRLIGCRRPIQLAPIGGLDLVAAVCDAGGLGMLATHVPSAAALEAELDALAARTRGVFGVNFLMPFLDPASLEIAARKARVVEFFYGEPDAALVKEAAAAGALVGWQVGSIEEAVAAESAGCDFLVAQGSEAGGHVRGTRSLLPLLAEAVNRLRVPVVAAGGIATARDLAAVLACGAGGARLGTRFVASLESDAHPRYVAALLAARAEDTCLTEAFSVGWPNAPHRVLRSAIDAAERFADELAGESRYQGTSLPIPRLSPFPPTRETTGHVDAMALYAGESVASIDSVKSAAEIIEELCSGADQLLRGAP
jgi:NAD(P)H-dependent flavin oxidoreductase YrpB (nitropropane dioxygenase family)